MSVVKNWLLLAAGLLVAVAPAHGREKRPELERVAELVRERTDQFRGEHDREPLKVSDKLAAAARYFADFMARTDKYGHEADGKEPSERAKEHGYDYCIV